MVPGRRGTLPPVAAQLPRGIYLAIGEVLTHPRFHPFHRRLYRWSGGLGPMSRALGVDMILVTGRGRRSGADRTVPLAAVRDRETWVVVGSNAGKERMPAWVHNLRDEPNVLVQHRRTVARYRAREAVEHELEHLWELASRTYPGFGVYRGRTARSVPLFVLEPVRAD